MTAAPLWRQVFDAVEGRVAATAESVMATERFADAATTTVRATAPVARLVPTSITPNPARAVAWVGGQLDRALHRTRNGVKVSPASTSPSSRPARGRSCGNATGPSSTATTARNAATPHRCY